MELRRLGEPLLKTRPSPLLSFLVPSIPLPWHPLAQIPRAPTTPVYPRTSPRRNLHSTTPSRAETPPTPKADLNFPYNKPKERTPNTSNRSSPSKPPSTSASSFSDVLARNNKLDDLIRSTLDTPNPRRLSQTPQSTSQLVEEAYSDYSEATQSRRATDYYNVSLRDRGNYSPGSIAEGMDLHPRRADLQVSHRNKRTIRSNPSIGRTVELNAARGVDFARALGMLDAKCRVNGVRRHLAMQKFHERPGLKRKRLRSERWRRLFRSSFQATVKRVQAMRRKGW